MNLIDLATNGRHRYTNYRHEPYCSCGWAGTLGYGDSPDNPHRHGNYCEFPLPDGNICHLIAPRGSPGFGTDRCEDHYEPR